MTALLLTTFWMGIALAGPDIPDPVFPEIGPPAGETTATDDGAGGDAPPPPDDGDIPPPPDDEDIPPPPEDEEVAGAGFLLQLEDKNSLLTEAPVVTLTNADGEAQEVEVLDDGENPDVSADDGVYAGPVLGWTGTEVNVVVQSGGQSWTTSATIDPDDSAPLLRFRIKKDGTLGLSKRAAPPSASKGGKSKKKGSTKAQASGSKTKSETASPPKTTETAEGGSSDGVPIWSVFLALLAGLGIGGSMAWTLKPVPVQIPSFNWTQAPAAGGGGAWSVGLSQFAGALAGPMADKRLLVVGRVPLEATDAHALEPGSTAEDVVAAAEWLALQGGPSLSILVADTHHFANGEAAVDRLVELVDGRCDVFVLDGPTTLAQWSPTS